MTMHLPPTGGPSATALAAFARRDLLEWRGLPPRTSLPDVPFSVDHDFTGTATLGNEYEPADWVAATADGFPDGIRVWTRGDRIIALDAQRMDLTDSAEKLLATLGEPEARWDASIGPMRVAESEWVYPGIGLTLYIDPETRRIDRVLGYEPTTLSTYAAMVRPHTFAEPAPYQGDSP